MRVTRTHTVAVHNTSHWVYSPAKFKGFAGAYATTRLQFSLTSSYNEDAEAAVAEFVDEFQKESDRYYNLKQLAIYAPYAIIDGNLIEKIMSSQSTLTDLDLNVFGFHTPVKDMWTPTGTGGVALNRLDVTFNDGVAYSNAGTDLLAGLERNKDISRITIENKSPHIPVVRLSKELKYKMYYTSGVKLKVV